MEARILSAVEVCEPSALRGVVWSSLESDTPTLSIDLPHVDPEEREAATLAAGE